MHVCGHAYVCTHQHACVCHDMYVRATTHLAGSDPLVIGQHIIQINEAFLIAHGKELACAYVCMYVCMYACMYVCVHARV